MHQWKLYYCVCKVWLLCELCLVFPQFQFIGINKSGLTKTYNWKSTFTVKIWLVYAVRIERERERDRANDTFSNLIRIFHILIHNSLWQKSIFILYTSSDSHISWIGLNTVKPKTWVIWYYFPDPEYCPCCNMFYIYLYCHTENLIFNMFVQCTFLVKNSE